MRTYIIAEIGLNHNASIIKAKKMIDVFKKCGANAVKFQTAIPKEVVIKNAKKANYQKKQTSKKESQFQMLKKYHLKLDDFMILKNYCRFKKIDFISSAFDIKSVNYLNKIGLKCFKIPSGEIDNIPYLKIVGKLNKKIILSTGMSTYQEISNALKILIKSGTDKKFISLLHCISEYPTSYKNVNLNNILELKTKFKTTIGFSDHTLGIEISLAAVALGAKIIEKHVTLNKKDRGPDHFMSLEPTEFKNLVESIRNIEKSILIKSRNISKIEKMNKKIVRKSIVAINNITKNEYFSEKNIGIKRPGHGLPPLYFDKIIGKKSDKNYKIDEFIKWKKK